jgi:hypothetical protein
MKCHNVKTKNGRGWRGDRARAILACGAWTCSGTARTSGRFELEWLGRSAWAARLLARRARSLARKRRGRELSGLAGSSGRRLGGRARAAGRRQRARRAWEREREVREREGGEGERGVSGGGWGSQPGARALGF